MSRKVLIVEDDPNIARLVRMHVLDAGFEAEIATTGEAGLAAIRQGGIDLVVLDRMLPGIDGLEICRQIRASGGYIPILILTAKSTEIDRVLGLEMGADDYLTKPFSIPELMARIKALFRRVEALGEARNEAAPALIDRDGLKMDIAKRQVWIDGTQTELTAREFDLLHHFASHPGRVFSRVQLLDQVWGYQYEGYEHTVNTHINRLRGKIESDPAKPRWIETVWGVGYRFAE
jgi:two-component system, OmpR family, response regulator